MAKCKTCDDTGKKPMFFTADEDCPDCQRGKKSAESEDGRVTDGMGPGCLYCGNGILARTAGCINCIPTVPPPPLPAAPLSAAPSYGSNGPKRPPFRRKTFPKQGKP